MPRSGRMRSQGGIPGRARRSFLQHWFYLRWSLGVSLGESELRPTDHRHRRLHRWLVNRQEGALDIGFAQVATMLLAFKPSRNFAVSKDASVVFSSVAAPALECERSARREEHLRYVHVSPRCGHHECRTTEQL